VSQFSAVPRLPDRPRTRVEEVIRARGLTQTELAERAGWQVSTVNRIALGRTPLNQHSQSVLARLLSCEEHVLHQRRGSAIPPPLEPTLVDTNLELRVAAVLSVFGLHSSLEGLLRFLASGDFSGLHPDLMRRIKDHLRKR
jgi:transcriptional regulator with XRE-family HTH domain